MPHSSWIARVCDLEGQGRFDEARWLFEQNTTSEQRASFEKGFEPVARAMANIGAAFIPRQSLPKIDPEVVAEIGEVMKRIRAAQRLHDGHPKKDPWLPFLEMTPRQVMPFWRLLLDKADPLKSKGRPARSKIPAEHFAEMTRRVAAGEKATPAAKALVGGDKHRADYLVKRWRKSGIK